MSAIAAALGTGSGIDTNALVSAIASASRAARDARLGVQAAGNDARISTLAKVRSGLDEWVTKASAVAADTAATPRARADALVTAYNALHATLRGATAPAGGGGRAGALSGEREARATMRVLAAAMGEIGAALGVATNRDGSLRVDGAALDAAVARDPAAVTAALATVGTAMEAVRTSLTASDGPLTSAAARYARTATQIARARETIDRQTDALAGRLTSQFAAMERAVSASKATQAYMSQQVAAWNAAK